MRDRGPIPLALHQTVEPLVGLLFIVAPFVLGFDSDTAKAVSVVLGVLVLLVGMTTRWRMSVIDLIPLRGHFMADVGVGVVAIAAPFVLGFSDDRTATIFLVVMGVLELGAAFGTAWDEETETRGSTTRVTMPTSRS
jgi:cyanate permease